MSLGNDDNILSSGHNSNYSDKVFICICSIFLLKIAKIITRFFDKECIIYILYRFLL